MARHFRGRDVALRFIEYMDVGATNGWRMDEVLPSAEVVAPHRRRVRAGAAAGVGARRDRRALALRRAGVAGEIGTISSVTQGVLPRLQPGPPVDRRQALPLPVREPRPRPARAACAAARATPRSPRRSASSGSGATTATPSCAAAPRPRQATASGASRCTTSAGEPRRPRSGRSARPTSPTTSGCATTCSRCIRRRSPPMPRARREKEPADYLHRLGLDRRDGGHFVLGAWRATRLRRRDRLRARGAPQGAPHRPRRSA